MECLYMEDTNQWYRFSWLDVNYAIDYEKTPVSF